MAMRAMNAISSPLSFRVHTAAAEVGSPQLKHSFQHRALNPRSLIGSHEGRPGILNVRRGDNRNFSVAVRAAGTAEATTSGSATEISLEELKRKGDSYFLTDTRPVILFDGVCNFCNGGVNFMLDNDTEGHGSTGMDVKHLAAVKFDRKTRFAALQSEAGRALLVRSGRAPDDLSSIVLVDKDRSYIKSEAILRIGQFLKFPYPPAAFAGFIFPMFFRDAVYNAVANNRYSIFGTTASCRLSDPRFTERFIE